VAGLVLLVAAIGVAGYLALDRSALEGTSWKLVRWSAGSPDPSGFTITASFERGQISGVAAVNSYSGECAVGARKFVPGAIARTEMAGPPEAMEAEGVFFELLASAKTYAVDGDVLSIEDDSGTAVLVFERTAP
jgi:heat shock protein HslJ